ncbi:MAG: tetratricopeptide repeat protein [Candidatus Nanoarchaeia archaeon]
MVNDDYNLTRRDLVRAGVGGLAALVLGSSLNAGSRRSRASRPIPNPKECDLSDSSSRSNVESLIESMEKSYGSRMTPYEEQCLSKAYARLSDLVPNEDPAMIAAVERALELNPENPDALANKGLYLGEVKGKHKLAAPLYRQALEIFRRDRNKEGYKTVLINLGTSEFHLGNHKESYELFLRALKFDPNNATALRSKRFLEENYTKHLD